MARVKQTKLERDYQVGVLDQVRLILPGCIILKNDSGYQQGIPDWSILWFGFWAFLEIKRDAYADEQPNQGYFVELADEMCFGAFIYPENEEEVLHALFAASRTRGASRVPRSQQTALGQLFRREDRADVHVLTGGRSRGSTASVGS